MEDVLVKDVVDRVKCSHEQAFLLLHRHGWNIQLVLLNLSQNINDIRVDSTDDSFLVNKKIKSGFINNDASSTFPDLTKDNAIYWTHIEREILEKSMRKSLEESKHLNWWVPYLGTAHKLFPISTIGDGNCLLHAVSQSMFGVSDRLVILRKLLYEFCTNNELMASIERRWRLWLTFINAKSNLVLSEVEWHSEWNSVTSATTLEKVGYPQARFIGLEDIHIFILAHVIKRPIIVLASDMIKNSKNESLSPSNFPGIYIPYECSDEEIVKCPVILGFDTGHFAPLVYMHSLENRFNMLSYLLPTICNNGEMLPLKFNIDPGRDFCWTETVPDDTFIISKSDYSDTLRKYFCITTLEVLNEDMEDKCLDVDLRPLKAIKLETFKNFGRSVLKLRKPKITSHPYLPNAEFIQISIKEPENFSKIVASYLDIVQGKTTENFAYTGDQSHYVEPVKRNTVLVNGGFGIGNSRFYMDADLETYKAASKIPKSSPTRDNTLYLSKSTFFNDTGNSFDVHSEESDKASNTGKSITYDYIPYVDNNSNLNGFGLPQLDFESIQLPHSLLRTLDFTDKRPPEEIASEVASEVLKKLYH